MFMLLLLSLFEKKKNGKRCRRFLHRLHLFHFFFLFLKATPQSFHNKGKIYKAWGEAYTSYTILCFIISNKKSNDFVGAVKNLFVVKTLSHATHATHELTLLTLRTLLTNPLPRTLSTSS